MPYLLAALSLLLLSNVIDQYSSWLSGFFIKLMSYSKIPISIFFIYHYGISTISSIDSIYNSGYQGVQSVDVVGKSMKSGLLIYTPENGDRCMDSPIPCTPYINENLTFHEDGFFPRNYFMIKN
jgi:hypothetical protein